VVAIDCLLREATQNWRTGRNGWGCKSAFAVSHSAEKRMHNQKNMIAAGVEKQWVCGLCALKYHSLYIIATRFAVSQENQQ
jgi:hypothetical protein